MSSSQPEVQPSTTCRRSSGARCQFHQRFYVRIFHTNKVLAAFSSYVLALAKSLYKKRARKTLMKLTKGRLREGMSSRWTSRCLDLHSNPAPMAHAGHGQIVECRSQV